MRLRAKKLSTLVLVGCVLLFGALNVVLMQLIHSASTHESVLAHATASWHVRVLDSLYSPFSGGGLLPLLAASVPYPILDSGAASAASPQPSPPPFASESSSYASALEHSLTSEQGHSRAGEQVDGAFVDHIPPTEPDRMQQPVAQLEPQQQPQEEEPDGDDTAEREEEETIEEQVLDEQGREDEGNGEEQPHQGEGIEQSVDEEGRVAGVDELQAPPPPPDPQLERKEQQGTR
jgi:hypothetical protein